MEASTEENEKPFQVLHKNNFQASDPPLTVWGMLEKARARGNSKKKGCKKSNEWKFFFCINARESHEYHNSEVSFALMNRYSSRRFKFFFFAAAAFHLEFVTVSVNGMWN